jgi:hypothetical protein
MLGGIAGQHRSLLTEGPYGVFEQTCERLFGEEIRQSDEEGSALWSALAKVDWTGPNGEDVGYSFRAAGDLIAALKREGDYMAWYCSGPDGFVSEDIAEKLAAEGWRFTVL